ncbi:MAG: hypothetical protein RR412_02250 [Burkholderiaceae bacterium]
MLTRFLDRRFALVFVFVAPAAWAQTAAPASASFDRFKSLAGDWVDADGAFGTRGKVAATYRITGAGSAVVERLMPDTPNEMTTVYHKDGDDLALTHYCAAGNQPRMRARKVEGPVVDFAFDGGSNFDPARDMHMHSARIEFVSPDEIRQTWQSWNQGAPAGHAPSFRLIRKRGE